jgi:hypothetical protein
MKKLSIVLIAVVFVLMVVISAGCGGDKAIPVAKDQLNLLTLLPDNAAGIMQMNFSKFSKLDFFDKMIKGKKESGIDDAKKMFEDYQDFVAKTGIDPKKDIYSLAVAFAGEVSIAAKDGKDQDLAAVINLNYDREKVMALLKETGTKYTEEAYKGLAILNVEGEGQGNMAVCFIDNKTIAAGKNEMVKKVIDLAKGEGQSVLTNAKLKPYIDKFKSGVILSFVFEFPESAKKVQDNGMVKMDFSKAEVIQGSIDYDANSLTGVIEMISDNEQANKDLANTLNGFKGMGAMAGPEVAELVNNIKITGSADRLTLAFTISDELAEKLKTKMEEKAKVNTTSPNE